MGTTWAWGQRGDNVGMGTIWARGQCGDKMGTGTNWGQGDHGQGDSVGLEWGATWRWGHRGHGASVTTGTARPWGPHCPGGSAAEDPREPPAPSPSPRTGDGVAAEGDVDVVVAGREGDVLHRAAPVLVVLARHLRLRGALDGQAQPPGARAPGDSGNRSGLGTGTGPQWGWHRQGKGIGVPKVGGGWRRHLHGKGTKVPVVVEK